MDSVAASLTDVELDSILQCPVSRRRLRRMTGPELEEQNRIIGAGAATFLDGRPVSRTLSAGLVSDDGRYIYPDQEGLLFLMREWAIPAEDGDGDSIVALDDITKSVRDFYDDVGWERGEEGAFADADLFEDLRPVSARYIHDCHLRVLQYVDREGRFLLDAGSGPIQYPEYLAYSEGYCKRICVDISVTGLREAQRKLQDKGVYILADISNLPLASSSMDGVVSLHTIYHIPKERQEGAVRESVASLRPDDVPQSFMSGRIRVSTECCCCRCFSRGSPGESSAGLACDAGNIPRLAPARIREERSSQKGNRIGGSSRGPGASSTKLQFGGR